MSEAEELPGDTIPRADSSHDAKVPCAWRIALYPLFTRGVQRVILDLGKERILGRNSGMNIYHVGEEVFSSNALSRKHARLYVKDDRIFIEDLDSCNGTFVNGVALKPPCKESSLKTGDVLQLGCEAAVGKDFSFSLESVGCTCLKFVAAIFNDDFGEVDQKLAMSFYSDIISPTRESISSRGILLYPPLSEMLGYFESTAFPLINALREIISKDVEMTSLVVRCSKGLKFSRIEAVSRADSQKILMNALFETNKSVPKVEGVSKKCVLDRIKQKLQRDVLVPLLHPTVIGLMLILGAIMEYLYVKCYYSEHIS